jgi:hypothetical protein
MPLVKLQSFLNDSVTDSSHMARGRIVPTPVDNS